MHMPQAYKFDGWNCRRFESSLFPNLGPRLKPRPHSHLRLPETPRRLKKCAATQIPRCDWFHRNVLREYSISNHSGLPAVFSEFCFWRNSSIEGIVLDDLWTRRVSSRGAEGKDQIRVDESGFYRFTVKNENFNAQLRGQISPGRSSFACGGFPWGDGCRWKAPIDIVRAASGWEIPISLRRAIAANLRGRKLANVLRDLLRICRMAFQSFASARWLEGEKEAEEGVKAVLIGNCFSLSHASLSSQRRLIEGLHLFRWNFLLPMHPFF